MGYGCLPPLYSIWRPPAVLRCNKGQKNSLPERQIEMIARPKEFRVQCRNRDRIFWKGCVGGSAHRQDINRGDLITNGSIAIDELVDEARIGERYAYLRQDSHRRQNRHGGKGRKLCGPVIVQSDSNNYTDEKTRPKYPVTQISSAWFKTRPSKYVRSSKL